MMQPRVELVLGDMFDGPSDLIVLPCSTAGTVTSYVAERLQSFKLPHPKPLMKLGDIEIHRLIDAEQIAGYIAFAASVNSLASSADAIEHIGRQLGKFTNSTPSV